MTTYKPDPRIDFAIGQSVTRIAEPIQQIFYGILGRGTDEATDASSETGENCTVFVTLNGAPDIGVAYYDPLVINLYGLGYGISVAVQKRQGKPTVIGSWMSEASTTFAGQVPVPAWYAVGGTNTPITVQPGTTLTFAATSPLTASGAGSTITYAFSNQSANTGLFGPTSGGAAAPTFRGIVSADLTTALTTPPAIGGTTAAAGTFNPLNATTYIQLTEASTPASPANTALRLAARDVLTFSRLGYVDSLGTIIDLSRDRTIEANNATGSTIAALRVVRVNGASGTTPFQPTITPAQADSSANADGVLGVTFASISNTANGRIMMHGLLSIDTSSVGGTGPVYIDPTTAGVLTLVKPSSPNVARRVGYVLRSNASGLILIDPGALDENAGSAYAAFTGATSIADGTLGLVPKPLATQQNRILTGDGTWKATVDDVTIGGTTPAAATVTTFNTTGLVVFNDAGADVDFRAEGDTDANLIFLDASTDRVGIGTSAPSAKLNVSGGVIIDVSSARQDYFDTSGLTLYRASSNVISPLLIFNKARGSVASPAAVSNGNRIGYISFSGYDGSAFVEAGYIKATSDGAFSGGVGRVDLAFGVADGGVTIYSTGRTVFNPSSTNAASINLGGGGSAPTSPEVGDEWQSSDQNARYVYMNPGLTLSTTMTMFTQTATVTVANTGTETTLTNTGVGSLTLQASFITAGKTTRTCAWGYYGTDTTNTAFDLRYKVGGVTFAQAVNGSSLAASVTNGEWECEFITTCYSTGAGGTAWTQGWARFYDTATGSTSYRAVRSATNALDTTAANAIDITADWTTGATANTITCTNLTVEILN